nr:unnamed protein product [Digitaria exilis]
MHPRSCVARRDRNSWALGGREQPSPVTLTAGRPLPSWDGGCRRRRRASRRVLVVHEVLDDSVVVVSLVADDEAPVDARNRKLPNQTSRPAGSRSLLPSGGRPSPKFAIGNESSAALVPYLARQLRRCRPNPNLEPPPRLELPSLRVEVTKPPSLFSLSLSLSRGLVASPPWPSRRSSNPQNGFPVVPAFSQANHGEIWSPVAAAARRRLQSPELSPSIPALGSRSDENGPFEGDQDQVYEEEPLQYFEEGKWIFPLSILF